MREIAGEAGRLRLPALVLHGGAGTYQALESPEDAKVLEEALSHAIEAGWSVLSRSPAGAALDAAVAAVISLEDSGCFNAGRGAVPTDDGAVEFDASVMTSEGLVGAIAATGYPANPIAVARLVATRGGTPDGPILLAGEGADRFAREAGVRRMEPGSLVHAEEAPGTVGAVAVDADGRLAAATSTGGRSGQMRGRVGDTPIPGAGVWADEGSVAVSATGTGEVFVVVGFAHRVDWAVRAGSSLQEAVDAGLQLVAGKDGEGGCVALTPDGQFAARFNSRAMARAWRDGSSTAAKVL